MSVRDGDLVINIQDGLKGDIVSVVSLDQFLYCDNYNDLNLSLNDITFGEYLVYRTIHKLLADKRDIIIKFGQKK